MKFSPFPIISSKILQPQQKKNIMKNQSKVVSEKDIAKVGMKERILILAGIFAALLASIFPQDPLGGESTFPGTLHLVIAGLTAFVIMVGILLSGLGMDKQTVPWRGFKLYSVITVMLVFIFGAPTPILIMNNIELLGLFERLTQLAYLQWFVVFAAKFYSGLLKFRN